MYDHVHLTYDHADLQHTQDAPVDPSVKQKTLLLQLPDGYSKRCGQSICKMS